MVYEIVAVALVNKIIQAEVAAATAGWTPDKKHSQAVS